MAGCGGFFGVAVEGRAALSLGRTWVVLRSNLVSVKMKKPATKRAAEQAMKT